MKCKRKSPLCVLLAAVLTLTLAACGGSTNTAAETSADTAADTPAETSADTPANTSRMPADVKTFTYERDGLELRIWAGYNDLVTVDTDPAGALFSVSEKKSIEVAEALGEDAEGAGWLFNIATADTDELHEMLCEDMSGVEPFAKDRDGQYYLFCTPTDVRVVREDYENPDSTYEWDILQEWVPTVPDAFLNDNPDLIPEKHSNTLIDMYLARIAYREDIDYTLSKAAYGAVEAQDVDALPYVDCLIRGVTFDFADDSIETPDGEYVVLDFPNDGMRFDFFLSEGAENYVRIVWSDGEEELYEATFADGVTKASDIVSEWYDYVADDSRVYG